MSVDIFSPSLLDGLESEELELLELVNEYRGENGLPPITASKALTTVANRHVRDVAENLEITFGDSRNPHSWSWGPYDSSDRSTYPNMWEAPQRLNTGYPGIGYENFFLTTANSVDAEVALEAWKNSSGHNNVILNRDIWSDRDWNAIGVGIYEGYAALWFGEETDPTGLPTIEGSSTGGGDGGSGGTMTDLLTGEEVHRFWDVQTESHFFTASQSEFSDRQSNPARYSYEGVEFEALAPSTSGALPVYRFENERTGTFFYTLQTPDEITGQFPVFESDGVAFYAFSPNSSNGSIPASAVPIHRFYNEDASAAAGTPVHFFTGSEENKNNVIDNFPSFTYEGPGWYALSADGF
ncbi:MAG: CAP domain-containing protein [Cyanobacteriota bacterium]|nr:CAP domain-containing protein [Cyanobacteriota bacterium]